MATATAVIDGDTFLRQDGNKIRLLGIDTPEKGMPYYQEAKARLADLIKNKELSFQYGAKFTDKYGRILAFVYVEDFLVNALLVEEGLARTYFFRNEITDERFNQICLAQQRARLAGRGIWSLPAPRPANRYFGNESSFRFHRPDCYAIRRADTTMLLRFVSRDQFLDRCFSPCRNCNP